MKRAAVILVLLAACSHPPTSKTQSFDQFDDPAGYDACDQELVSMGYPYIPSKTLPDGSVQYGTPPSTLVIVKGHTCTVVTPP